MVNSATIQLCGGLGNIMFQTSVLKTYCLKNNVEPYLTMDNFQPIHKHLSAYKDNILSNIEWQSNVDYSTFKVYQEPNFSFNKVPQISEDILLKGYFQSEKYFKEYRKEILELFTLPEEIQNKVREKYKDVLEKNPISIHLRLGDYQGQPSFHPVQKMSYYNRAMDLMPSDSIYLVFSDDIEMCKSIFGESERFLFIEGNEDYEDMFLMSLCSHNIIANSSFSWWGAWMNQNPDKIVVAPEKWFGPSYKNNDTKDLYCEGWIKI
jgi:hypothetical protein